MLRVTAAMRADVPTCAVTDRLGEVKSAVDAAGWDLCIVVNEERIVLGLLYGDAWNADPDTPVENVMSNGPPTTRPSTFIDEEVERLRKRRVPGILVTSSDGALLGYLRTADAETALATGNCTRTWTDRDCSPSEA